MEGVTEVTIMVMILLLTDDGLAQIALLVIITLTCAPLVRLFELNVWEFVPTFEPFNCH